MTTPDRREPDRPTLGPLVLMRPEPGETKEEFKARFKAALVDAGALPPPTNP